jgi:hypothetical protein
MISYNDLLKRMSDKNTITISKTALIEEIKANGNNQFAIFYDKRYDQLIVIVKKPKHFKT